VSASVAGRDRDPAIVDARTSVSGTAPHMDWSAVFAGALLASAVGFVLVSFGTGLGLSMGGPVGDGTSPKLVAITVGLWTAWVVVSSFMAGGYLTGRLRRRAFDATAHEVEVRDGSHGVVVWALGVLVAGYLTASGIASLAGAGVSVVKGASSVVGGQASSLADPMDHVIDALFRSDKADKASGDPSAVRSEIARLVARSVQAGSLEQADRDYLTAVVSRQTGLDQAQVKARVDGAVASVKDTAEKAKVAAEKARKSAILASFLAAALLLVSAAAAWWAATMGGKHRDEGTDFSHLVRW
jgi:hypothetical protein